MWIMMLTLPMAYLIGACMDALPEKQRKIPAATGWFFILPCLMSAVNPIVQYSSGTPLSLINSLMISVGALLCYYVNRAIAFVGLTASYQTDGRENRYQVPALNVVLAWSLAVIEPLWMAAIFILAFFTEYPGPITVPGMAEIMMVVTLTLAIGIGLSYVFLMAMYSLRNTVFGLGKSGARPLASKPVSVVPKAGSVSARPPSIRPDTSSFKGPPPISSKHNPLPKPLGTGGTGWMKEPQKPPEEKK
jgi:hypothetical protein